MIKSLQVELHYMKEETGFDRTHIRTAIQGYVLGQESRSYCILQVPIAHDDMDIFQVGWAMDE